MNNIWYPTSQWTNPFNENKKFDIILSDTEIVNMNIYLIWQRITE